MRIIAADDEALMLDMLTDRIRQACPQGEIHPFSSARRHSPSGLWPMARCALQSRVSSAKCKKLFYQHCAPPLFGASC